MNYQFITDTVVYADGLLKNHPSVFHAFVPIGAILTAILGFNNTGHLKKQANLQREIENNRYKLELFDKRFSVYDKFKGLPDFERESPNLVKIEDAINIIGIFKSYYVESKKTFLVFNLPDNDIIHKFSKLCFDIITILEKMNLCRSSGDEIKRCINQKEIAVNNHLQKANTPKPLNETALMLYNNMIAKNNFTINNLRNDIDILNAQLISSNDSVEKYKKRFEELYIECHSIKVQCESYMENKLVVPELAFEQKGPGLIKRGLHKVLEKRVSRG